MPAAPDRTIARTTAPTTARSPARTLLLGDWHPLMRDPLDLLRLGLVVAAAVAFAVDTTGDALVLTGCAVAGLVVRPLLLPRVYDLALLLALFLQGVGEASGAYDSYAWFDRVVHVSLPLLTSGVLYVWLARLNVLPDPRQETHWRHHLGIAVVTFSFGAALGAVWELVEWLSDATLGTALQEGNHDTVGDLAADCVGALAAAGLLVLWTVRGWGSVRRIPNSHEEGLD